MTESAIRIWRATAQIPVDYMAYFRGKTVRNNSRILRGNEHIALVWNTRKKRVDLVSYGLVVWSDNAYK